MQLDIFLFSQVVVEYLNIHKSDNNFKIKVNNLVFRRTKICSVNFKNTFNRKIWFFKNNHLSSILLNINYKTLYKKKSIIYMLLFKKKVSKLLIFFWNLSLKPPIWISPHLKPKVIQWLSLSRTSIIKQDEKRVTVLSL